VREPQKAGFKTFRVVPISPFNNRSKIGAVKTLTSLNISRPECDVLNVHTL
jgi:hypothetical protein